MDFEKQYIGESWESRNQVQPFSMQLSEYLQGVRWTIKVIYENRWFRILLGNSQTADKQS